MKGAALFIAVLTLFAPIPWLSFNLGESVILGFPFWCFYLIVSTLALAVIVAIFSEKYWHKLAD